MSSNGICGLDTFGHILIYLASGDIYIYIGQLRICVGSVSNMNGIILLGDAF